MEQFASNGRESIETTRLVQKYCTWVALNQGILTEDAYKGFYLYNGRNPSIDGLPLFFKHLSAIQEYREETNQEQKAIGMIIC